CYRYGFDPQSLTNRRGHRLPLRVPGSTIARGPALVVGDAAGLIDPLSGEGIHNAFLSARLAADAIGRYLAGEAPDLTPYQAAVNQRIMPNLIASHKLQDLFHQAPSPYVALLRYSDRFWRACCHLIRGELDYAGFVGKLGPLRPLFEAMVALARRRHPLPMAKDGARI
ncbi:MAG: NAD(P)/FAD-dependent oxidoreductase, partial [Dehalococcoidia bacterium]